VVHRQLRRDASWDGRPVGQSDINNNILRQNEEQRHGLRESGLRDGNGNGKRPTCCAFERRRGAEHDLQRWIKYADLFRWIRRQPAMVFGRLRRRTCWFGAKPVRQSDLYHNLLLPMGNRLMRQFNLRKRDRDGQRTAGCSDIGVGKPVHDLFGIEQHTDRDRWFGRELQVVYRQLRRNARRDGNVVNRQPDFDHDILRPLGDHKLR